MKRISVLLLVATSFVVNGQQYYSTPIQISSHQPQNDYAHLSEIPFENAVRAISTPQRDHIPIQEVQHDIPPPPRPQPVQNQQSFGFNLPQGYSNNVNNLPLVYDNPFPPNLGGNTPLYMITNENPNEIYNLLFQTSGSKGYSSQASNIDNTNRYIVGASHIQPSSLQYSPPVYRIPVQQNYEPILQKPVYSNFRPSTPIGQNHIIDLTKSYSQSQITVPSERKFRSAKSTNQQYSNGFSKNGYVQSSFAPVRSARMVVVPQGHRKSYRYYSERNDHENSM